MPASFKKDVATAPNIEGAAEAYLKLMAVTPEQQADIRLAFKAGAATLFYSIMNMLDPGLEPTQRDLDRMDKLAQEVDRFTRTFDNEWLARHSTTTMGQS